MPGKRNSAKLDVRQPSEHYPLIHARLRGWFLETAAGEEGPDERYASVVISRDDEKRRRLDFKIRCPTHLANRSIRSTGLLTYMLNILGEPRIIFI